MAIETVFDINKFMQQVFAMKKEELSDWVIDIANRLDKRTQEEVSSCLLNILDFCFTSSPRKEIVTSQELDEVRKRHEEKMHKLEQEEIDKSRFVAEVNDCLIRDLGMCTKKTYFRYYFLYPSSAEHFCNKLKQAGYEVTYELEGNNNYRFIISLE